MIDVLCIGHASFDIAMTVGHHPAANEKMLAETMQLCGGGPAANAAVQVARLGGKAAFCGYLGHDTFGAVHLTELEAEGVNTALVVRDAAPTPVSQVLAKPDGSRSVVNFKAGTPWLTQDVVDFNTLDALAPRIILFDGHEPLISEAICEHAHARHLPTMLDAGSVDKGTSALAGRVDFLVASEDFARQWCNTDDMQTALATLGKLASSVVITLGVKGLIWRHAGESGVLPTFPVQAVDSTGAGDAFHGALALAVARKMEWQEALRFASAAGALACTRLGARTALADTDAIRNLLRKTPMTS